MRKSIFVFCLSVLYISDSFALRVYNATPNWVYHVVVYPTDSDCSGAAALFRSYNDSQIRYIIGNPLYYIANDQVTCVAVRTEDQPISQEGNFIYNSLIVKNTEKCQIRLDRKTVSGTIDCF